MFPPPLRKATEEDKFDVQSLIKPTPKDWFVVFFNFPKLLEPHICFLSFRDPLKWIDRFVNDHDPLFDFDEDKFSDWYSLRGTAWRGKDCDDLKDKIYPGRFNSSFSVEVDHNCNGIYGHNENGTSFEDLFCSETPYYGQAILGDSAAAHFHIPPDWVTASKIATTTFDNLINILMNELDWPEMSATTGYTYSTWEGHPKGPVISSYQKALQQNRCTHRGKNLKFACQ